MEWNRSELYFMAQRSCTLCGGVGTRDLHESKPTPCGCVYRAAFRACLERFRICIDRGRHLSRASLEQMGTGRANRVIWSRKDEEFIADFELVSRRYLDQWHYRVFRYFFILGADWKLCSRRLGIDRGNFFHAVYRVEERLGKVFANLEPYALYPPRDYFVLRLPHPARSCRSETEAASPVTKIPKVLLYGRLNERKKAG
jgi:hypothetical protein